MQNLGGQTKSIMVFSKMAYWGVAKCRGSWVVGGGRESRVDVVGRG